MTAGWETQSQAARLAPPNLFPLASPRRSTMNKHHPTAALREMETQTLNLVSTEFCSVQTAGTFVNLCFSFLVFLMIFEADFP